MLEKSSPSELVTRLVEAPRAVAAVSTLDWGSSRSGLPKATILTSLAGMLPAGARR
uniref:Uncharacterized protein n=1 Tax=uncultured marine group II/III euryarchaeote AD1000_29_A08 TaxID=1457748 RepID=A0A075FMT8_9EURY|nr:hypothetical protein [uncultured marine group II/III euryarchaeote AD1000_29_A08]